MNIKKLEGKKLKPLKDRVALIWSKPKATNGGIALPENYFDLGLRIGKFLIGEVIAIGPKVTTVKLKDSILIPEYGIKDFRGTWKEDEIYFVEEEKIQAKVKGLTGLIFRKVDVVALEKSLDQ